MKAAGAVGVVDGTAIARAMIAAGQSTRALDILELASRGDRGSLAALRDPAFDSIRNDRRFLRSDIEAMTGLRIGRETGFASTESDSP